MLTTVSFLISLRIVFGKNDYTDGGFKTFIIKDVTNMSVDNKNVYKLAKNKYAILVNINNGIFTKRSYEDIYHEDDDFGVDFNTWNKESYSSQVYNKADNIIFRPKYNSGGSSYENEYAYYVDENYERVNPGKCTYSGGNFSNQDLICLISHWISLDYPHCYCFLLLQLHLY